MLTLHIFYSVLLELTFRRSQSHQQNGNEALKLWRSQQDTWIHSTILLQHFLFLQSQHLMVSLLEYFLTMYSEHKLSAVHLQNPAHLRSLLTATPKVGSTTHPQHLLTCCLGFVCRVLVAGGYRGGSPEKLLEASPMCDRAIGSQLQCGPAAGKATQCH